MVMQSKALPTSSSLHGNHNPSPLARLCRKLSPRRAEQEQPFLSSSNTSAATIELQRVFNYLDENGDGKISAKELQSCVRTVGGELSVDDAETAVVSSDIDGDGQLGFEDFQRLMEGSNSEEEKQQDLRQAFGMYETEPGSGFISPASLKRMLARLGDSKSIQDCKQMIRAFDLNGDGLLSFHEFSVMMR